MFVFILESSVIVVIFTVFIKIAFIFGLPVFITVLVCVMCLLFLSFLLVLGFISNLFIISISVLVILVLELSFFQLVTKTTFHSLF